MSNSNRATKIQHTITVKDLPLACPTKDMSLWSTHPRVYLFFKDGQTVCPYCNTTFVLMDESA